MKYFTFFPKINYSFPDNQVLSLTNIFIRPNIKLNEIPGINVKGNKYVVEDGETPDTIAKQFYENPELFWYVLNTNNILDFYNEWPVSFDLWRKELADIHGSYTFFTPYLMDIQKGDIVAKYITTGAEIFDKDNFGVIIDVNSFLRSFDVDFVKGEIKEKQSFVILRKSGRSYTIVKTPFGSNNQVLKRRQDKLNSTVSFLTQDKNSKEKVNISPYTVYGSNESVSQKINDITGTNCILSKFLEFTLGNDITQVSFSEESQKKWIFNKTINIIPKQYTGQINELYLNALTT